MSTNRVSILPVPEILRRDVECFMLVEFTGEKRVTIKVIPNGIPGIVFHHNGGSPAIESIITPSGHRSFPPTTFVYGPGIESSVMNFKEGSYTTIQVILKPHALKALFGINAMALAHSTVDLNEFSAEDINGRLIDTDQIQTRVALLSRFLITKLSQEKTRDAMVEHSLQLIHQSMGSISVRELLERLDISERQFERRFSQAVGITPLSYIRIKRFHEAMRLMKAGQYDRLTDVAYALNFHDQSHFIRDIKAFSGITPKELLESMDALYHGDVSIKSFVPSDANDGFLQLV